MKRVIPTADLTCIRQLNYIPSLYFHCHMTAITSYTISHSLRRKYIKKQNYWTVGE